MFNFKSVFSKVYRILFKYVTYNRYKYIWIISYRVYNSLYRWVYVRILTL
nr:MAG TPA: hypothetical protein [Caudoviricetes sp.]